MTWSRRCPSTIDRDRLIDGERQSWTDRVQRTLVRVATVLRDAEVGFALTGGSVVYARGGPFSEHDVDVLVRPGDVDTAVQVLVDVGMRAADAPEDWLRKVYDGDVLVQKLLVLGPHHCDYTWVLPAARALREQVDWEQLAARTAHSPYAAAFLLLAERLGIAPVTEGSTT